MDNAVNPGQVPISILLPHEYTKVNKFRHETLCPQVFCLVMVKKR